jgi:hypothetical protein
MVPADTDANVDLYDWSVVSHTWNRLMASDSGGNPLHIGSVYPASRDLRYLHVGDQVFDTVTGSTRAGADLLGVDDATGDLFFVGEGDVNGTMAIHVAAWDHAVVDAAKFPTVQVAPGGDTLGSPDPASYAVGPRMQMPESGGQPTVSYEVGVTARVTQSTGSGFVPIDRSFVVSSVVADPTAVPGLSPVTVTTSNCRERMEDGLHVTGDPPSTGEYSPMASMRVLDTRSGVGGRMGRLQANLPFDIALGQDLSGLGANFPIGNIASIVLNVTVTQPDRPGYLTVYPGGSAPPNASNLNFVAGQTVANLVAVRVPADGDLGIFSNANVHVIFDLVGYYATASGPRGGRLVPVPPVRIMDSRDGEPFSSDRGFPFPPGVAGEICGLPDDPSITSVALNVTAVDADQPGYVRIYETDWIQPNTSNLNVDGPGAVPNMVMVRPIAGCVDVGTNIDQVDLVVDVTGVFVRTDEYEAPTFSGQSPTRVLDTRVGLGAPKAKPLAWRPVTLSLAGRIPPGTTAVLMNVTVTEPTGPGFVSIWPADEDLPLVSSLNFTAGQTVPNLVLVPVSADGSVNLMPSTSAHLVADLAGVFSGPG